MTRHKQKTKRAALCTDGKKGVLRAGSAGEASYFSKQQGEAFGKEVSPSVENKETCCHSRIKSLCGLAERKETMSGERNKRRRFCNDSTISHELPCSKGKSGIQKRSQAWEGKEQRLNMDIFYSP